MERLFRVVQRFYAGMHMKLAVSKTIILSNGPNDSSWSVSEDEPELEALLVGKYLGVDIRVKGRNLVKAREEKNDNGGKILCSYQNWVNLVRSGQSPDCT